MSAARKLEDEQPEPKPRQDLRLEMKVKNNVLWHAIFDHYRSVSEFCRAHSSLTHKQTVIGELLRFKTSPFHRRYDRQKKEAYETNEYRSVCLLLEKILHIPCEDLFPKHLYENMIGGITEKVLEVESFTALPAAAKQELRLLPAPAEEAPEFLVDRALLRDRMSQVLKTLTYREREIIKLLYGIPDGYNYSHEQVGIIFKISAERIKQIEAKAVRKLQTPSRTQELVNFL